MGAGGGQVMSQRVMRPKLMIRKWHLNICIQLKFTNKDK